MTEKEIDAFLDEMSASKPPWSMEDMRRDREPFVLQAPEQMMVDLVKALDAFAPLPPPAMPFPTIEDIERGKREDLARGPAVPLAEISAALALYDAATVREQYYMKRKDPMTHYAVSVRKVMVLSALESWPFRED